MRVRVAARILDARIDFEVVVETQNATAGARTGHGSVVEAHAARPCASSPGAPCGHCAR
jgi:hypothetical protein